MATAPTAPAAAPHRPPAPHLDLKALEAELAHSQSATIYVDVPGLHPEPEPPAPEPPIATQVLEGDPALHVEFDAVRQKVAVRKATDEEVAEAEAAKAQHATT